MTKEEANAEFRRICERAIKEEDEILKNVKTKGLDGTWHLTRPIHDRVTKEIEELRKKVDRES